MGASGWEYRVPFRGSIESTLAQLQEQLLATGEYLWPFEDFDEDYFDGELSTERPHSLAELTRAKDMEEFWEEGTHTILDVAGISASGLDGWGRITPLTKDQLQRTFGTSKPTAADFDRVHEPGPAGALGELLGEKWSGRSIVISDDAGPTEVFLLGLVGRLATMAVRPS